MLLSHDCFGEKTKQTWSECLTLFWLSLKLRQVLINVMWLCSQNPALVTGGFNSSCLFSLVCLHWVRAAAPQPVTQRDGQMQRPAGLLLFKAPAWPGDCWLVQNRNAGVEPSRELESNWKPKPRLMAREREMWGRRERRYRATVSQQVDGASGCGSSTSLLLYGFLPVCAGPLKPAGACLLHQNIKPDGADDALQSSYRLN